MELYKHNQEAFDKALNHFKTNNKAAIKQPTGTGKSSIGKKLAKLHKNVLVIAPTKLIFEEYKKEEYPNTNIEYKTYAWLSRNLPETKYDLIILDEAHRSCATKWSIGVKRLFDYNKNAKILGITATPYRNDGQNAFDRFFKNNIVWNIDYKYCWEHGILPKVTYVESYTNLDNLSIDGDIATDEQKEKFNVAKTKWIEAGGIEGILKQYLKGHNKIIVFCKNIESIIECKNNMTLWLDNINSMYQVHSKMSKIEINENFEKFSKETEGINLMFSVNMLNEGVHIDGVTAVAFFRTTVSEGIFLQQMGRCLKTNAKSPVVIDLVGNASRTNSGLIFDMTGHSKDSHIVSENNFCGVEFISFIKEFEDLCNACKNIHERIEEIFKSVKNKYSKFNRNDKEYTFIIKYKISYPKEFDALCVKYDLFLKTDPRYTTKRYKKYINDFISNPNNETYKNFKLVKKLASNRKKNKGANLICKNLLKEYNLDNIINLKTVITIHNFSYKNCSSKERVLLYNAVVKNNSYLIFANDEFKRALANKGKIKIKNTKTNKVYNSLSEACIDIGRNTSYITNYIKAHPEQAEWVFID